MKKKIDDKYINEAIRIREIYLKNLKRISEKEPLLKSYRNDLTKIENDILAIDINDKNRQKIEKFLEEKVMEIDDKLIKIQSELNPINLDIEKLKKDSDKLYDSIKEKYTKLTPEEIKNIIWEKVKHIII